MVQEQQLLPQHGVETKKKENVNPLRAYTNSHNGKLIVQMQLCIRCNRTLPYKKGRKSCPYCQATLRTMAMVLKAP